MGGSESRDDDPATGPAASLDDGRLRGLGAVLWTVAFLSVTAVILFADGTLAAIGWRDATLVAVRTFAGVIAFLVVFPIALAALSALGLR